MGPILEMNEKAPSDFSLGAFIAIDEKVRIGLVIYFFKTCIGLWILK